MFCIKKINDWLFLNQMPQHSIQPFAWRTGAGGFALKTFPSAGSAWNFIATNRLGKDAIPQSLVKDKKSPHPLPYNLALILERESDILKVIPFIEHHTKGQEPTPYFLEISEVEENF